MSHSKNIFKAWETPNSQSAKYVNYIKEYTAEYLISECKKRLTVRNPFLPLFSCIARCTYRKNIKLWQDTPILRSAKFAQGRSFTSLVALEKIFLRSINSFLQQYKKITNAFQYIALVSAVINLSGYINL